MTTVLRLCPPTASPPRPFFALGHGLRHNRARRMRRERPLVPGRSHPFAGLRARAKVAIAPATQRAREPTDCRNLASEPIWLASDERLVGFKRTEPKAPVDFFKEWSHKRRSAFISPACDSANLFILYVVRRRGPLTPLHKSLCNAGSGRPGDLSNHAGGGHNEPKRMFWPSFAELLS